MPHRISVEQRIFCIKNYYSTNNISTVCTNFENEFDVSIRWHTVNELVKKFELTGNVADKPRSGRSSSINSERNQVAVSATLRQNPQQSTRKLSRELDISQRSIVRIIKKLGLKVWRPRLLQELHEDDFDRRMQFCEEFDVLFNYKHVIWTDEAIFKLNGQVNRHNCVYYSDENPHQTFTKSVNSPSIMVWAGICSTQVIGPFFFRENVTGKSYQQMLENFAFPEIRQIGAGAGDQHELWWQQDGAPPHLQ